MPDDDEPFSIDAYLSQHPETTCDTVTDALSALGFHLEDESEREDDEGTTRFVFFKPLVANTQAEPTQLQQPQHQPQHQPPYDGNANEIDVGSYVTVTGLMEDAEWNLKTGKGERNPNTCDVTCWKIRKF